jgi:hypothetical protein
MSYLITAAVSFLFGALVGYLALRNNPRVRRGLDRTTTSVEDLIDRR